VESESKPLQVEEKKEQSKSHESQKENKID